MAVTRRIFVSGPRERYLDERTIALRRAILGEIERPAICGEIKKPAYELTAFGTPEGGTGLAVASWSRAGAIATMRRCIGTVLLGFPYRRARTDAGEAGLVSEYCHYEGAIAAMLSLPILALLESGTAERVAFNPHGGDPVLEIPGEAGPDWVRSGDFGGKLERWVSRLNERRDVFLGYSSSARPVAALIKSRLEDEEVKVHDWDPDFDRAGNILPELENAAALCSGAIFLFTKEVDEGIPSSEPSDSRENVLFEAGLFINAKGKKRVLLIREEGVSLPADLRGDNIFLEYRIGDYERMLDGISEFTQQNL